MLGIRSPISILAEEMAGLLALFPAVRDGDGEAIHGARVSTRRIREALSITEGAFEQRAFTELSSAVRRAGRALGRVRDADVSLHLVSDLDARLPFAAAGMARVRASVAATQQLGRRRLIKTLERLDLAAAVDRINALPRRGWLTSSDAPAWRDRLRAQIAARAGDLRQAVHHATGVYFPNRSHSVRVAVKKMRYALELADRTGLWHPARSIRRLKKVQEALGQVHDRQVLIDELQRGAGPSTSDAAPELQAVIRFLEGEVLTLHARYSNRRADLFAICDGCERMSRPSRATQAVVAAGLALSPLLILSSRLRAGEVRKPETGDVRVRVRLATEKPVA